MTNPMGVPAISPALDSANPLRWLSVFGPGAIMASLTIGTGELIFSSRGGAIFGYRILFLFVAISALKWVLVYSTARHMVLTGVHPFERWLALPGPRGWLPAVMFVFAIVCFPIWVSFHSSVIGDLLAGLTGTKHWFNGASIHAWGGMVLLGVTYLALRGGYQALERVQLLLVSAMLGATMVSLFLLRPDWWQMLVGTVVPQSLSYPDWMLTDERLPIQLIAKTPIWEEASLYVGVVGGASYDYLAYTSFLRNKSWGLSSSTDSTSPGIEQLAAARPWLRAPLVDCTMSFFVVVVFSAVFVASGAIVLGPQHQIPGDGGFLEHQAQFVTKLHPWLYPLYVVGTLLAMLGTLYGTLEVAPPMVSECYRLLQKPADQTVRERVDVPARCPLRRSAIFWCGGGAFLVLLVSFSYQFSSGIDRPPGLTNLLKPASLFTGVLSCGFICLLNPWMDRALPATFRAPLPLRLANIFAGVVFLGIGLRAYWSLGGATAIAILSGTLAVGCFVALLAPLKQPVR